VTLDGKGRARRIVRFPASLRHRESTWLIVPLNEGISYPVDDATVQPLHLHYLQRGMVSACRGSASWTRQSGVGIMSIIETPDDARIDMTRQPEAGLFIRPLWEASRGLFSYTRKITYCFFDKGGYVAQAKRYREYAKATGLISRRCSEEG